MLIELQQWFFANNPLIVFLYGETFFLLGFAILLQTRRGSRLELARHLPWLAAFGILHGLNEWGDLFIPIQANFLPPLVIDGLKSFQILLMAFSFLCLFQFGLKILKPWPEHVAWVLVLPVAAFLLWFLVFFVLGYYWLPDIDRWHAWAEITANYMLCVPGSVLAAIGLWQYVHRQVAFSKLPQISRTLRVAGFAFLGYAVVDGLIGPPGWFFPANLINYRTMTQWVLIPKPIFLSVIGFTIAFAIIRSMEIFNLETNQLIERMEQGQVIAVERERIGRDLHDGALQRMYAAGLLAQSLRGKVGGTIADGLDSLMAIINEAMGDLRHYVSDLRPVESVVDLAAALAAVVKESQQAFDGEIRFTQVNLPVLPPDRVAHIAAFTREALSNAIRHAHARSMDLVASMEKDELRIRIRDDGSGIPAARELGFGLRNMQDRTRLLGGVMRLDSRLGKGTDVLLQIPIEAKRD
jgi:signal transduction histidine kinase